MVEKILRFLEKRLKTDVGYTLRGGSWLISGHFVGIVATLLTSYIFANYLSPEIYGQYKYILTIGIFLTTFSLTGSAAAVSQAAARNISGFLSYIKKISLSYGMIISLISIIGAVYYFLHNNQILATGLLIIAVLQPFLNSTSLIQSHLQGTQQFKRSVYGQSIKTIFVTSVIALSAFITQDILVLLTSYYLAHIISNYILEYYFAPKNELLVDVEGSRSLLQYAKHSSLRNIFTGISDQLDKILIFQNLGAAELAHYTFATALPEQLKGVTKAIEQLLLPRYSNHSKTQIIKSLPRKTLIYFCFLVVVIGCYILVAPFIYKLLFPAYIGSTMLSQIYSVSMIFALASLPVTALKAHMAEKQLYTLQISTSVVQVFAVVILLYTYGLIGIIAARFISRGYFTACGYYLLYKVDR